MDDWLGPYSAEAERAVIGSMLIDARCIPAVLAKVSAADFYIQQHQDIFETMSAMFDAGQPIDAVLVRDKLSGMEAGDYLRELMERTPTSAHALEYAGIVKEKSILRTAQESAKRITECADISEVQAILQKTQEATEARQGAEVVSMSDATLALYQALDQRHKTGGSVAGIRTGYKDLDALLGGLRAGNMLVVAARSGMGKSAFVLNLATEAARLQSCPVLIFSLEMNAVELSERVYANYAELDMHKLRDAALTPGEWDKLADTTATVTQYPIRIVEAPSLDMAEIARLCRTEKPALVIIDHIGLVRPSGKVRDRREAVDAISRAIKCLAKDLNIPVIAVAQLNRAIMARSNKEPVLSDLRESGAIEQDADAVLFVHRPAYYDAQKDKTAASLIVAKNRHGRTDTIPLIWNGARQRFIDDWTKDVDKEPLSGTFGGEPSEDAAEPIQEELPC